MASIFISYRRADSEGYARTVYQNLVSRFGEEQVFLDVEDIGLGSKFAEVLDTSVAGSAVLLVLIGKDWLSIPSAAGSRRLDDPDDFVRREVADGLAREGLLVIPVLVGGATLPAAADLPADLAALPQREALTVQNDRFDYDIAKLIQGIETRVRPSRRRWYIAAGGVGLLALAAWGASAFIGPRPQPLPNNVWGYVTDIAGTPLEDAVVRIQRSDGAAAETSFANTDSDGLWLIATETPADGAVDSLEVVGEGCQDGLRVPLTEAFRIPGDSLASEYQFPTDSVALFNHQVPCAAEN